MNTVGRGSVVGQQETQGSSGGGCGKGSGEQPAGGDKCGQAMGAICLISPHHLTCSPALVV